MLPGQLTMLGGDPATDAKAVAEREWHAPLKPPKSQKPCDVGLFSDDAAQLDLVEMLQDPTNGE